ncbi:MAG: amino acid adenylation domain-containing protein, partial [Acidobacteriota bacterium]|nr:amino acid adenylation domain-containing protein [Acidobacteriota bacterium]
TLGVGPDVLVGLCCERSIEMLVGIYGILKSGGAYVPLDPSYPKERLAFMLDDTRARVLLTQQRLVEKLPRHGAQVLCLDTELQGFDGESRENPINEAGAENLAYVIYTSGSTGQPKGVPIAHGNLLHSTRARLSYYREPVARYLLLSSFAFDSSVAGIFWTLCQGGTLVVPQEGIERDPREVIALVEESRVSHMLSLPSLYRLMLAEAKSQQPTPLRTVVVAGEACPVDLIAQHRQTLPETELFNEYGPTEGTVWSTVYDCRAVEPGRQVPIGRPIANTRVYLLDRHLNPVPVGVPGELHVGGAGVARRGYLNQPELTAARFIPDPFSTEAGARLYKTGDIARYLSDGNIEFLGRSDEQVKIRGYRIELGEIESVLRRHEAVGEAVVIAREDTPGDKRLVAYLVRDGKATPNISELRHFLTEKLPEYMVPSAFLFLRAIPLTPNGKVDRQALPAPDQTRPELEEGYVAPRTELERYLASTWGESLGVEKVGVHDHFFELGGNSIQAAIIINKLQAKMGEYIHVATLFRKPRIADLASYLKEHYPSAVANIAGAQAGNGSGAKDGEMKIDAAKLAQIRSLITPHPGRDDTGATPKNPPAVFILCAPRSGSTLLRVMLAGNPDLFVPPEIELLNFNTLAERKSAFTGPEQFLAEGLIRAVMEIKGCNAEGAKALVADYERRGATTKEFYRQLQEWIGDKLLVDKTACYALDPEVLKRAETDFENTFYIHLLRHPRGMIRSFEEVRLDQVFFR